ncbi:hypothetical protein AHAS_Ahas20G0049200 [Arachis hypogaea]
MQSWTALARCESVLSDNGRGLIEEEADEKEETFLEDLLLIEATLITLATFAPSLSRNLTGDNLGSLGNLKDHVPMTLFLFLLRKMVSFSLTSTLEHILDMYLKFPIADKANW